MLKDKPILLTVCTFKYYLEGDSQTLRMINGHFKTTFGDFFWQNWGSDGCFKVLNSSESYLFQNLSERNEKHGKMHKTQKNYMHFFI